MYVHVKIWLIVAALSGALSAAGQRPVPFMWIPKANDIAERNKYLIGGYPVAASRSKADIVNTAMGLELQPYVFTPDAIEQLITLIWADNTQNSGNGIRLYFAAYDAAHVPTDFSMGNIADKQIVLLFCGSTGYKSADVPFYYVISPADMTPHKITKTIFDDWCKYYYSNEDNTSGLASTLERGHKSENQYRLIDFDTRSIYYDTAHFIEFLHTERMYQDTCKSCNPSGVRIDGIGIYFAAYLNTGIGANPYGETPSKYKNRFLVLWEFLRGGQIFFIEDAPGFCDRPPTTQCELVGPNKVLKIRRLKGGGDNGQLCPPSCPQ